MDVPRELKTRHEKHVEIVSHHNVHTVLIKNVYVSGKAHYFTELGLRLLHADLLTFFKSAGLITLWKLKRNAV